MDFLKVYKCPSCSNNITVNLENYIVDTSSHERGMGDDTDYTIECEGTCSICGANYSISGSIWEYPSGTENLDDTKIKIIK